MVSLVAKVRDTAGGLYQQARDKYSRSEGMQRAVRQGSEKAGQAATKAREKYSNSEGMQRAARQASEKAGQAAAKARDLAGKVARAKNTKNKGITGK